METTGHTGGAPSGPGGLASGLLGLAASLGSHVESLCALAGEEAREAGELYIRLLLVLGAGIFFVAFGYVLLLLTVAFSVSLLFPVSWVWILLGLTLLHFLGAAICGLHLRSRWRTPVFPATKAEISRDFEALKGTSKP